MCRAAAGLPARVEGTPLCLSAGHSSRKNLSSPQGLERLKIMRKSFELKFMVEPACLGEAGSVGKADASRAAGAERAGRRRPCNEGDSPGDPHRGPRCQARLGLHAGPRGGRPELRGAGGPHASFLTLSRWFYVTPGPRTPGLQSCRAGPLSAPLTLRAPEGFILLVGSFNHLERPQKRRGQPDGLARSAAIPTRLVSQHPASPTSL